MEFSKKFNIGSPPYKGELFWCGNGGRLLGFDLYNSTCSRSFEIEQPIELGPMEFFDCVGLGVCLGCLRICQILVQSHICVWELKDYDSQGAGKWCLEHKASLKEFVSEKSLWPTQYVNQIIPLITVLGFHPIDGNILYLGIELKAVVCNLRKKSRKRSKSFVICLAINIGAQCAVSSTMCSQVGQLSFLLNAT